MSEQPHSANSIRPMTGEVLREYQRSVAKLRASKGISKEAWAQALKEQAEEAQANASPIPVVFPVND